MLIWVLNPGKIHYNHFFRLEFFFDYQWRKRVKDKMQSYQKIKIRESDQELFIQYKWFTPAAVFLVFFCIAWDSFLFFWYSMLGDAPWIFAVFPLVHVAVGVGLTYYTACLFFNKTLIRVDSQILKIKHAPLPWFGDKEISAADISQLYVKEVIQNTKNGVNRNYQLRAVLKNGDDIKIIAEKQMGDSSSAGNVKKLERKIEDFMGIQDYAVKDEYDPQGKLKKVQIRRPAKEELNPTRITLGDLKKGYILNYESQIWEAVHQTQYDWKNGETDYLYNLTNDLYDSKLLYVQKRMGVYFIRIERKVDLYQLEDAGLTRAAFKKLPSEIDFDGNHYYKEGIYSGTQFVSDLRQGVNTVQCLYVSKDKNKSLRLVKPSEGALTGFAGKRAEEYEFSNILPKE